MTVVIVVAVVLLIVVVIGLVLRARRGGRPDGVDAFRRQIDALSRESRRPTIEKMNPSVDPDTESSDNEEGPPHGT